MITTLKEIKSSSGDSEHQGYCCTDNFLGIDVTHAPSSKQLWLLILSSSLNYNCSDIIKSCYNYNPKYFCTLLLNHDHMS